MELTSKEIFRIAFILGLMFMIMSLFVDWYGFRAYNSSQELVASWDYNFFSGWVTSMVKSGSFNELSRPGDISVPLAMIILSFLVVIISGYNAFFNDLKSSKNLENSKLSSFLNVFLLILVGTYCFVFPIILLLQNGLYFPFVVIADNYLNVVYHYSIGPGYYMQVACFISCVPYSLFYQATISKFQSKENSRSRMLERYKESVKEKIDYDKLIADEELKQNIKGYEVPEDFLGDIIDKTEIIKKRMKLEAT